MTLEQGLVLEAESQRNLQGPGPADLIQRAQAAEARGEHLSRTTEVRIAGDPDRIIEIGVIEEIECVNSRLQVESFGQTKLAANGHVQLRRPEATQHITS